MADKQRKGIDLLECAPRADRATRPAIVSAAIHGCLIALAIVNTGHPASRALRHREVPVVTLAQLLSNRPVPAGVPARALPQRAASQRGFHVLQAPAELPTAVPPIDSSRPMTVPQDFTGAGLLGGSSPVVAAPLAGGRPYDGPIDGGIADDIPSLVPGQMGPSYPDSLRDDALDGYVLVRFVIDTLGRIEPATLDVVHASHHLFASSVRTSIPRLRFTPGRFSGQPVRVRLEQRFEFHLASR